jgi:hypothetical protein
MDKVKKKKKKKKKKAAQLTLHCKL